MEEKMRCHNCKLFVTVFLFLLVFLSENMAFAWWYSGFPTYRLRKGHTIYLSAVAGAAPQDDIDATHDIYIRLTGLNGVTQEGIIWHCNFRTVFNPGYTNYYFVYNLSNTPFKYTATQDTFIDLYATYSGYNSGYRTLPYNPSNSEAFIPPPRNDPNRPIDFLGAVDFKNIFFINYHITPYVTNVRAAFSEVYPKSLVVFVPGADGDPQANFADFRNAFARYKQIQEQQGGNFSDVDMINAPAYQLRDSTAVLARNLNTFLLSHNLDAYSNVFIITHSWGYAVTKVAVIDSSIFSDEQNAKLARFYHKAQVISISPILGGHQWAKYSPSNGPFSNWVEANPAGNFQTILYNRDSDFKNMVRGFQTHVVVGDPHLKGIWAYRHNSTANERTYRYLTSRPLSFIVDPFGIFLGKNSRWYGNYQREKSDNYHFEYSGKDIVDGGGDPSNPHMALLRLRRIIQHVGQMVFGNTFFIPPGSIGLSTQQNSISDGDTTCKGPCEQVRDAEDSLLFSDAEIYSVCHSTDPNEYCVRTLSFENLYTRVNFVSEYYYCTDTISTCTPGESRVINNLRYYCSSNSTWQPKKENNQTCATSDECLSNYCSSGRCIGTIYPDVPPHFNDISNKQVEFNNNLSFSVSTSNHSSTFVYTAAHLPAGATFANRVFNWRPTLAQAGMYNVLFIVSNGGFSDYKIVRITVNATDTIPPTGSITINAGAASTRSRNVTLTPSASDTGSGVSQMKLSNDNVYWSSPEAFATTKSWILSSANGTKTVYVKFKDAFGNWSSVYSDSIFLDNTAPTGSVTINHGAAATKRALVTLTISATDTGSGVSQMQFSNDSANWSSPEAVATTKSWSLTTGNGRKVVYVKFKDALGNWSHPFYDMIILDTIAPAGKIIINGGAASTTSVNVTLTLSATDPGSGVSQMMFSNDRINWSSLENYATNKAWTLTPGNGTKRVYVRFRDAAWNFSEASDTIILDPAAPTLQ